MRRHPTIYGRKEKNIDGGEDKVSISTKEICLRVNISVVFSPFKSGQEYLNCGLGFLLATFPRTEGQGGRGERRGGRMTFHMFYILKAVVNNVCLVVTH